MKKIERIQELLRDQEADGWLFYDYHGSNRFTRQLLSISPHKVLTRRFFYWIPKEGMPQKIVHKIESNSLDQLPGQTHLYLSWKELELALKKVLQGKKTLLMEYSPKNAIPQVSVIDAGLFELVTGVGVKIESSANLLQHFTSILDEKQIASHLEAAAVLEKSVSRAWELIADRVRKKQKLTEYQVQQFLLEEFKARHCLTEEGPICAVNSHSAQPHYMATPKSAQQIKEGDFILIDLWCKKNEEASVYADITRVAVAAAQPTEKQKKIFETVFGAQKKAIDFMRSRVESGKSIQGYEVDDVCRNFIKEQGYGDFFTHRTGHDIDTQVHGSGANFDNLETEDQRQILSGMCFSVEPGIYLANEFGVRLETNILILPDTIKITGGMEEKVLCLL
jgi:Xaa-Pro dipeptidase